MSLLSIVQKFARRTALPVPATVAGNTDAQINQIMNILEEECTELAARGSWKGLINECTFSALGAESQGTLASLGSGPSLTNGLRFILNNTLWNRTTRLPIYGPMNPQDWQQIKANSVVALSQYRIRGTTTGTQAALLITPAPTAANTIAFEYLSNNWCLNGVIPSSVLVADTDTLLLPESVVAAGLKWRWKKEKGLSYAEDFMSYEQLVQQAISRDGTKKTLNMADCAETLKPGIFISPGSWSL